MQLGFYCSTHHDSYLGEDYVKTDMDLEHLANLQDIVSLTGNTLNIEKKTLLQSSLTVLLNENHFSKAYFWGRIFSLDCDYYVAFGFRRDILRGAVYYYSKNAVDWVILPKPTTTDYFLSSIITTRFMGDPSLQTTVLDDAPTEESPVRQPLKIEERNKHWKKQPTYTLKEENRLAATVKLINREGVAIPRGALYKQPNGDIVPNKSWYGMTEYESKSLVNYSHYRKPVGFNQLKADGLREFNCVYDFLPQVHTDIPVGFAWSKRQVDLGRTACLKSLYWPGAVSYNVLESPIWGFMYFGSAKRNIDVPFMI